jgi:hypothetical protein
MQTTFPPELAARPQWVVWRLEKDAKGERDTKIPYNPRSGGKASSTNPDTWTSLDFAEKALRKHSYSGLGFMFTKEAGIVGVDIDHCIVDGALNETAAAILEKLPPTYMEISPSGTGMHIFLRGVMPDGGSKNSKSGVEMYVHSRYFTMTGRRYGDSPSVVAADGGALAWIHEQFIAQPKKEPKPKKKKQAGEPLSNEEILEKARSAKNGAAFAALWEGRWESDCHPNESADSPGTPTFASQSEADLALCCKLAFWTGKDRERMDRMFRQSGLMREKWDARHHASGATYGQETLDRALDTVEEGYGAKPDTPVFAGKGRYFRSKGDNVCPLTNFVVQPIEMLITEDETQMTADLVTVKGEVFRVVFQTTDFSNLQRFKNLLNKRTIALSYTGSEGDLELLKNYLNDLDWARKTGVAAQGLYWHDGRWAFAALDGAIEAGGKAVNNLLQLERCKGIQSAMHRKPAIRKEQMAALGPLLMGYNEPAKTVSVLAWTAGCFIKPHLRKMGIKFPHLFLIGEAGSGKSNTLERVILPIFSQSKVTAATQVTGFTLMQESASSNLAPQPLDEFKPSKMDKTKLGWLYNHFRDAYDGHQGQRGRADQTVAYYDLLAPLVVAGEESPDETAIRERGIELLFSRKDLKDEARRDCFNRLCAAPERLAGLGRALLEAALRSDAAEVKLWYDEACGQFDKALPSRIVNNLACCAAGLRLLEKLCTLQGLSWDSVFGLPMRSCTQFLGFAAKEYLLDGSAVNRGIVEQSLEIMARMGLTYGLDWKPLENDTQVAINLKRCYDRFTKYRRDHAISGECLEYRQFTKQLRNSDLFIAYKPVNFNNRTAQAFVLNYPLLLERCDIEGFDGIITVEPEEEVVF